MVRLICAAVLVLVGGVGRAASLPKSVVDRVTKACVLIQAVEGKDAHAGSGFFVGRGDVLTNYHVVKAAAEGDAKVVLVVGTQPGKRKLVEAEVLAGDEELDLALLRTKERSVNSLRFVPDRSLRVTQQVWVVGFPFGTQPGLEATLTTGTISSLRLDESGRLREVQVDAAINPGNSGGPVIDARGSVVGVSRATIKPTVGSGMALAIPSGVAEQFVKVAQRTRRRTARMTLRGRPPGRGARVVSTEKSEEPWGTAVRITLRGSRSKAEALPFDVEVTDRRRNRLASETIDPAGLESREEKTFTIRLRGVAFDDVMSCRIVE